VESSRSLNFSILLFFFFCFDFSFLAFLRFLTGYPPSSWGGGRGGSLSPLWKSGTKLFLYAEPERVKIKNRRRPLFAENVMILELKNKRWILKGRQLEREL